MKTEKFLNFIRSNDFSYDEIDLGVIWHLLFLLAQTDESDQSVLDMLLDLGLSKRFIAVLVIYARENNLRDIVTKSGESSAEIIINKLLLEEE